MEDNFWNEGRVKEFVGWWNDNRNPEKISEHDMNKFKQSKSSTKATDDVREHIKSFRFVDTKKELDYNVFRNYGVAFCLNNPKTFEISSALSKDKTEWKIGDETQQGKIKEFKFSNTENLCAVFENNPRWYRLEELTKAEEKKVLFVTQDGKNIYRGDAYYSVSDDFQLLRTDLADECDGGWLRSFSTKEAAEKWIAYNTKSISFADLEDYVNKVSYKNILPNHRVLDADNLLDIFKKVAIANQKDNA